ncbi:MAG: molecular chaperone [Oceanospirillaceae bacterium]
MISGFDYGTSNCAIGVMSPDNQQPVLLPLENGHAFLPSTVYALGRELICEQVAKNIVDETMQQQYMQTRQGGLNLASRFRVEESIRENEQSLFFGRAAFDQYFAYAGEGYFVKSAKSFLGAKGVRDNYIQFFEDIVTVMMLHIKQQAQLHSASDLSHTVIGRPVNFQGVNSETSNIQALSILETAAKRAGFKEVEFLYEPIAAGFDFERELTCQKNVLVVDIGGGTSDCAMVQMGPKHINKIDRKADFLGHVGERVGGNDFDIHVAARTLMPLLGMNSVLKSGLPMPTQVYWNAVCTNDLGAQAEFNKLETSLLLEQLLRDTTEPQLMQRFHHLRKNKLNQQLVRSAEQTKINLSDMSDTSVDLSFIEENLTSQVAFDQLQDAVRRPLKKMISLMSETIEQAGIKPDVIYITGGSAKSPVIRQAIAEHIGDIEIVNGDHFGSVTSGLTLWASRIFK